MQRHQAIILTSVKKQIDSGKEQKSFDWDELEEEASTELDLIHSQKMRKRKPVAQVYSFTEYEQI